MTIINIRGTHGSGKSTIVKKLLVRFDCQPIYQEGQKKPVGYVGMMPNNKQLYIVGPYETSCGGCDAVQPYARIWPLIEEFAKSGHVVFEGALVSSSYGNIGRSSESYGDKFVFAFMDTPLKVCLNRILKRRQAKGNMNPLDPKNTRGKLESIERSIPKIKSMGRKVIILNHKNALAQVLGLLYAQD